jgi:hypothetical protein
MIQRTYDLEDRLIDFVLKIDQIVELLPNSKIQTPEMRIEH